MNEFLLSDRVQREVRDSTPERVCRKGEFERVVAIGARARWSAGSVDALRIRPQHTFDCLREDRAPVECNVT